MACCQNKKNYGHVMAFAYFSRALFKIYIKEAMSEIYYWHLLATGSRNSNLSLPCAFRKIIAKNKSKIVNATELTFSTLSFFTCNPTHHSAILLAMWAAISHPVLIWMTLLLWRLYQPDLKWLHYSGVAKPKWGWGNIWNFVIHTYIAHTAHTLQKLGNCSLLSLITSLTGFSLFLG